MASYQYKIQGMSCSGCAQSIQRKLLVTPGVESAEVDFPTAAAAVTFDEKITNVAALAKVIESLGFDVVNNSAS